MSEIEPIRSDPGESSLEVHLLGLVDFEAAQFLQEKLIYEISGRDDAQAALLICEHPPLITVGREGSRSHIRCDDDELTARMLDVRWVNRGGGAIVHTPGQLAVYPIVPLARRSLGLLQYRELLRDTVVDVCRDQKLTAEFQPDRSGVYCRTGLLAQFGIAVKRWISYHGLFLNVAPDLSWSRLAQSRDQSRPLTSLQAARGRQMEMNTIRESVIRHLSSRLGYERLHLYTGHRALRRTKKATVYA